MLIKFFVSAANNGYLNGLATEFKESTNSIRKELNNLSGAGYLVKSKKNNKIIYNANTSHPMFAILHQIALTGEYARGIDNGNIEIIINGSKVNKEYLENIKPKIKRKIGRKVTFILNKDLDSNSIILFKNEKNEY